MIAVVLAALMMTSTSEIPPEIWNCRNQVEVWCLADGCAASAEDETTPMDIWASRGDGRFSICAYSGCWEGDGKMTDVLGRLLWAADDVEFYSRKSGFSSDVSLLIIEKEGVGFVRVGGLATPLLCLRADPSQSADFSKSDRAMD